MSLIEHTEFQLELIEMAAETARSVLGETLKEDDENEQFRPEYIRQLGEAGLCGIPTSEEFDGLGLGYLEYALALEEIAKVSPSYAVSVAVSGLPQVILQEFGTLDQKQQWIPGLAQGQMIGGFALSEPDSGSDAGSLTTVAEFDAASNTYCLNGRKFWITHGGYADVYIVMARTGGAGPKGVSAFIVSKDTTGLSFGKKEEKMGLRASPTAEMILENAVIPASNLIGAEGQGFTVAMRALDSGRITIAASALGIAQASLDESAAYACVRKQFNKAIIQFQGVGFMLSDMAIQIEQSRLLVHKAAMLKDAGKPFSQLAAMAKCSATDTAMKVTTDAVQVYGGYGYTREYNVERHMRDAKVMQIVEGTNQIQRLVIAKNLRKQYSNT